MLPPALLRIVESYTAALRPSTASAAAGALVAAIVVGAQFAREGTVRGRAVAFGLLLATLVAAALRVWAQKKWRSSSSRAIKSVLMSTQPEVGRRVLRALLLAERSQDEAAGESRELAKLHYERTLSRASMKAVSEAARVRARRFGRFATLALLGSALLVIVAPQRLLEGLDVALARGGRAPFPMQWLEDPEVEASPPAYLRQERMSLGLESADALPEGTELVFRGIPVHDGRKLVLTDGRREQPFADDGTGAVVARWELVEPARLQVAARFGSVLIPDSRSVDLHSLVDEVPKVELAGAPQDIALDKMERLELHWIASDDHSIVEVELVLRSAGKEERRSLERHPGDKRRASGGHVLEAKDPWLQRLFLPGTVRIEARDDDPREGSKWGKSQAFTIRPPSVGAPHVARYHGLSTIRTRLLDLLVQAKSEKPETAEERREAESRFQSAVKELRSHAASVTRGPYQGLEVPRGWATFADGQLAPLERLRIGTPTRQKEAIAALEQATLGLDQALESLAFREAQSVSKQLASVADEGAFGAHAAQEEKGRAEAVERLDIAIGVLDSGAKELSQLGTLGADLGSVALADLDRVRRSRSQEDYFHAELALLHMAQRLRRPNPSFGSKGGGGGGGVEAGPGTGGGQGSEPQGPTSEAESKFDEMSRELEELSQEHQEAIGRTSSALRDAERALSADDEEAKRRAEALRRAVMRLPEPGEAPGSGRASAALSREHAGAMAHELERLAFKEAIESGRRAASAGEDALRKGGLGSALENEMRQALQQIREQMQWAEQRLQERERMLDGLSRDALEKVSEFERDLAERAHRMLAEDQGEHGFPKDSIERLRQAQRLMEDAARRLSEAKGKEGLELQRDAQRLLEEAQPGRTDDENDPRPQGSEAQGGRRPGTGGDVPDPQDENRAEAFRKRVLEGLSGKEGGRLAPAIQRYAEGLLR